LRDDTGSCCALEDCVHVRGPGLLRDTGGRGERTVGKLHLHPVWENAMALDKPNEDIDIEFTRLDHLGEDEALGGRLSRHARGRKRGGGDGG
jgi:hypothetical protein